MNFFQRVTRIIKSNLHYEDNDVNFDNFSSTTFENSDFDNSNCDESNFSDSEKINPIEKEYYANLELPYGASFSQIKVAYKKLLKKYHPDRFYGNDKKTQIAQNVIKKLNIAYEYFEKKFN